MSVILLLLSISIFIAACFLAAFLWSVKSGQFDDDFSPAHRILFDEPSRARKKLNKSIKKQ